MTELLYMNGFAIELCEAKVLGVESLDDGRSDVVLDKTCFYPRGGGQDWDLGEIHGGNGAVFLVDEVRLDERGIVHHIGNMKQGEIHSSDEIKGIIDHERRAVNTRLHSAGHVIDMAIDSLGLDWVATKGQHYPHLSAVEYAGTWDSEKVDELRGAVEQRVNELIKQGSHNTVQFMTPDEMSSVCKHVPANLPTNKPSRVVLYGEFGIPCGGTHVEDIHEVGIVKIPKLKQKKGVIRVNYEINGLTA